MEYLTTKRITERLQRIQNRYNLQVFDDNTIKSYVTFVEYDKDKDKKRTRKEKENYLRVVCDQHYRELVKEYSHVAITKGKYGQYRIQLKGRGDKLYDVMDLVVSERLGRTVEMVYKTAESFNKIHSDKCVTGQVEFPTGNVLFANFFKNSKQDDYAFEIPGDEKYSSVNSINHSFGEQNTMEILSHMHGLGYVQLGNTSAAVYKASDDRIIITSCYLEYYDEDKEQEIDVVAPLEWALLGEVCCDVWRVEFIDQENFNKGDTLSLDQYDTFRVQVSPGLWTIKNSYHFMNDDRFLKKGQIPVWVELTKNGD